MGFDLRPGNPIRKSTTQSRLMLEKQRALKQYGLSENVLQEDVEMFQQKQLEEEGERWARWLAKKQFQHYIVNFQVCVS